MKHEGIWLIKDSKNSFKYWQSDGSLSPDVLDIDAMCGASATQGTWSALRGHHDTPITEDFGEPLHLDGLMMIFTGNLDLSRSGRKLTNHGKRSILRLVSAHEIGASETVFRSVADLMSNNSVHLHNSVHLKESTPRNGLIMLALALQYHANQLHVSNLSLNYYHSEDRQLQSFLLAESYADLESTYNILSTAVQVRQLCKRGSRSRKISTSFPLKSSLFDSSSLDHYFPETTIQREHLDLLDITRCLRKLQRIKVAR